MMKVLVRYPTFDEEFEVARRTTGVSAGVIESVISSSEILELQQFVRSIEVSENAIRYALALVRQTRIDQEGIPDYVREQLSWGAGPRAVQFLILGAKTRAAMNGRAHVSAEDIKFLAKPVLRHRIVVTFAAESEGISSDSVIARLIAETPTEQDELLHDARFQKIFAS